MGPWLLRATALRCGPEMKLFSEEPYLPFLLWPPSFDLLISIFFWFKKLMKFIFRCWRGASPSIFGTQYSVLVLSNALLPISRPNRDLEASGSNKPHSQSKCMLASFAKHCCVLHPIFNSLLKHLYFLYGKSLWNLLLSLLKHSTHNCLLIVYYKLIN